MLLKSTFTKLESYLTELRGRTKRLALQSHEALKERFRHYALVSRALKNFRDRKMFLYSGYFTFNAFLAVLALGMALTSILGFIMSSDPAMQKKIMDGITRAIPMLESASKDSVVAMAINRGVVGIIGLIGLVWTGTKLFKGLELGFAEIWDTKKRSRVKGRMLHVLLIMIVGGLFLFSSFLQFGLASLVDWLIGDGGTLVHALRDVFQFTMALLTNFAMFFVIYRFVPTVKKTWRLTASGALIAAALFLGFQYLLTYYLREMSSIPVVYGGVSVFIGLIVWLYLTGMITFFGEEMIHTLAEDRESPEADRALKGN